VSRIGQKEIQLQIDVIWTFPMISNSRVDISGDRKATVKREDGPWVEPPAALDL
jgi:hypothetical protein